MGKSAPCSRPDTGYRFAPRYHNMRYTILSLSVLFKEPKYNYLKPAHKSGSAPWVRTLPACQSRHEAHREAMWRLAETGTLEAVRTQARGIQCGLQRVFICTDINYLTDVWPKQIERA